MITRHGEIEPEEETIRLGLYDWGESLSGSEELDRVGPALEPNTIDD